MRIGSETERMMREGYGMLPMLTETGIQAFYESITTVHSQVMVAEGDLKRIKRVLGGEGSSKMNASLSAGSSISTTESIENDEESALEEKTRTYIKKLLSSIIKLPAHRIDTDAALERYGMDSIIAMKLTNELEKVCGSLSKTLFFEYQTIQSVSHYFVESYRDKLTLLLGVKDQTEPRVDTASTSSTEVTDADKRLYRHGRIRHSRNTLQTEEGRTKALDIAIIGLSGKYPQSRNIREFWKNLAEGRNCITEIPKERWDHNLYYDADKDKMGKSYSKWGGFIEGVDEFDPLFFNISPREAEMMDPQERLFLECVHATIEDAGYTREGLSRYRGVGLEGNVGIYVGVMYEEYQLYGAQEQALGRQIALPGNPSSIANRVSYFYNFHGPSMSIDTMCSSSLTAIHLACQNLRQGGCEVAIAGGEHIVSILILGP
jgi:polyketide synthase PksN